MASERSGLSSRVSVHTCILHLTRFLGSLLSLWDTHCIHLTCFILRHHTFASAGSDGIVSVWDHTAKKRLRQYPKYHNAVNDISFNNTGTKLAVGVSYGWEKGESASKLAENARVSVFIREIGDEVKVCLLLAIQNVIFNSTRRSSNHPAKGQGVNPVHSVLSNLSMLLPLVDTIATSALMYHTSSNTAISTCFPTLGPYLSLFYLEPGRSNVRNLTRGLDKRHKFNHNIGSF